ncbi:MAG: hypothetical protein UIG59_08175 [Acutalibacteraceae bacterium]|nr:hypothetical protein [Acutalibacteraceae bacterium]
MRTEELKQAFNNAMRLILSTPVEIDTLVFRKGFKRLKTHEQKEILDYINSALEKFPSGYVFAHRRVFQSEFKSDYYHQTSSRGPYRPVVLQALGGLMAACIA